MAPKPKVGAIDAAESHIIRAHDATYREVASAHGLSVNSLRARIDHKYGCLKDARAAGYDDPRRILAPVRRCIRCSKSSTMDHGQRICRTCRKEIAAIHEGPV